MKAIYPIIDNHKECGSCRIVKPLSEYSLRKNPNGSYAPCTNCKECKADYARKLRKSQGAGPNKRYLIIDDHKRCTACNENKHISEYSFKKTGMLAKCKPCMIEYHESIRRERGMSKRIMHPVINGIKKCSKCSTDKPVIEYFKGMHHCIDCYYEHVKSYRKQKIDHIREKQRLYYHNVNKEKHRALCKVYYEKGKQQLSDPYIKNRLTCRNGLQSKDIPSELVEIERKRVKLLRTIKQSNQ